MDYYRFKVEAQSGQRDILIAFFSELPFDTFEEIKTGFNAYIPLNLYDERVNAYLEELQGRIEFTYGIELIRAQNWNKVWESNFEAIAVHDFCGIRADFHPRLEGVKHEIIINPKMAFGTGHHETTFMVIEMMEKLKFQNKKVLDYGCGTGILAILAGMMGSLQIEAVDIEIESYENTIENARLNQVSNISAFHGTLESIESDGFDIILANINRNVILDSLEPLYKKLLKNGKLIVSGIIRKDEYMLTEKALIVGFKVKEAKHKNNWVCILFEK